MNSKTFLYPIVAVLAVLSVSTSAEAGQGVGVGGVDMGERKKPGGQLVGTAVSDEQGYFRFPHVVEGE